MPKRDLRLLVEAKRDGAELSSSDWEAVVEQGQLESGDSAQVAALFMACVFKGMTLRETVDLTRAMVRSGEELSFTQFANAVDKHSSGGVGDTASLIVVPLLASCGEKVAKLSGRALGHTGGTLDKLRSIPNVRVEFTPSEFESIVARVGCAIVAQTKRLVPADRALYALRDRTATVPSIGLIAASIASKKIAGGATRILFDVKTGNGAFMKTLDEAHELAKMLVCVVKEFGRQAVALVTDMNQPLSPTIGNGVEVILAREFLAGRKRPARLAIVVREIAIEVLTTHMQRAKAEGLVDRALQASEPEARFEAMIEAQSGDVQAFRKMRPLDSFPVVAQGSGIVCSINTNALGNLTRQHIERYGDLAGLQLNVSIGDYVERGQLIGCVFGGGSLEADQVWTQLTVGSVEVAGPALIYERIGLEECIDRESSTLSIK